MNDRLNPFLRRLRGHRVVVAVSGGSDSVGLLRLLHESDIELFVAHLDHGTRGEKSREDAAFVGDLAASLGLPFDLGTWSPTRPNHFETDARKARYDWLLEVAAQRNASFIAVGHTRDDQAETILHRILRGTGPRGLAGIPSRRKLTDDVTLIRPLLAVSRDEIRRYLASIGQSFCEDATNADTSRTRSRIRHDLLPKLADEYNPKVVDAIVRLGSLAGQAESRRGLRWRKLERLAIVEELTDGVAFRILILDALPEFVVAELMRRVWRRRGWSQQAMDFDRWTKVAEIAVHINGRFEVAPGIDFERIGETLRVTARRQAEISQDPVVLPVPGSAEFGGFLVVAYNEPDRYDETIDPARLVFPLLVGFGDLSERFDPLGMDGHCQTLNDFLRGRRVPPSRRSRMLVVRDQKGIVWVVDHRIADRVKITEMTTIKLGLSCVPKAF